MEGEQLSEALCYHAAHILRCVLAVVDQQLREFVYRVLEVLRVVRDDLADGDQQQQRVILPLLNELQHDRQEEVQVAERDLAKTERSSSLGVLLFRVKEGVYCFHDILLTREVGHTAKLTKADGT